MNRLFVFHAALVTMTIGGCDAQRPEDLTTLLSHATAAPVIYQLSRYDFNYAFSYPVTIRGANLTGTSTVTADGHACTGLVVVDDSTVTCQSPLNPNYRIFDLVDLILTTPNGQFNLAKSVYWYGQSGAGVTAVAKDYSVPIEVSVTTSPPSTALTWPSEGAATSYEISRKARASHTWTPLATIDAANAPRATSWQDTNVVVGAAYEYRVKRTSTILAAFIDPVIPQKPAPVTSYGYVYAGINVSPVDHRGTVVLIVDQNMAPALGPELTMLKSDLEGDGWSVIRHDVRRGSVTNEKGPVPYDPTGALAVKQLIVADYRKNPKEVKAVLLVGHVPVPYSGNFFPAGHSNEHQGAMPADVFYGDMDGVWTDSVVNEQTPHKIWFSAWNVPGDGKFDQSKVPTEVELEVGRVDLWAFKGAGEIALLKQYFAKNHNHRHALTVLPRRALMEEGRESVKDGRVQSGRRSWAPLVGAANIVGDTFANAIGQRKESYLGFCIWHTGSNQYTGSVSTYGSVDPDGAGPRRGSDGLIWPNAADEPNIAFFMTYGSHHGDWDHESNFLRAPLATKTYGLTNTYGSTYLHTLGVGGTFGESIRLKQNNSTTYAPYDAINGGGVHEVLMGDPTLRMFAVKPPSGLASSLAGSHPSLTWQASQDSSLLGYYVYRSTNPSGPFTRLTADPVTQTTWTDSSVSSGTFTYQVKAAKLETTASGTYVNTSQAITDTVAIAANAAGTIEFRTSHYAQDEGASAVITAIRSSGSSGPVSIRYSTTTGGTAVAGTDYTNVQDTLSWADGDMAPKSFTVPTTKDATVEGDETVTLALSSPTGGATLGSSSAVLTIANNGPGVIYQVSPAVSTEGNTGITKMTVTCNRVGGSAGIVSVDYATIDRPRPQLWIGRFMPYAIPGIDYQPKRGTLTWADGDTAPKRFDVTIIGNVIQEFDKFIPIEYGGATGGVAVQHPESVHNYILNDDGLKAGTVQLSSSNDYNIPEGNSGTTTRTIKVDRLGGSAGSLSVKFLTVDGTAGAGKDYAALPGASLTWADGDSASKSFDLEIVADSAVESNETFIVFLTLPPDASNPGAKLGEVGAWATVTVLNDDGVTAATTPAAPAITADDASDTLSAFHALGPFEIEVSRSGGAYTPYDGQISVGNVAVAAGHWRFRTKAVSGRNASADSGSPAFTVAGTTTGGPGGVGGTAGAGGLGGTAGAGGSGGRGGGGGGSVARDGGVAATDARTDGGIQVDPGVMDMKKRGGGGCTVASSGLPPGPEGKGILLLGIGIVVRMFSRRRRASRLDVARNRHDRRSFRS